MLKDVQRDKALPYDSVSFQVALLALQTYQKD